MAEPRIYLDHNASSPLRPEAQAVMVDALARYGNASSVHGEGRALRQLVEDAREQVAALAGCRPADVVFTSGATEANCTALAGGWETIYMADIEHDSVRAPAAASGARVIALPVDRDGVVDVAAVLAALPEVDATSAGAAGRSLLTLQMANNETGVCQDVGAAAALARSRGVAVHTDAVQACGRLAVDFDTLGVDLMSLSSHKIGGPMGIGALIVRDGRRVPALIKGGGQERQRRAGTENVAAIAGFGVAAELARSLRTDEVRRLGELRQMFERQIRAIAPDAVIIGAGAPRLANTLCIAFPGERAETTVIKLDLAGIAVSAGAACSSGKVGASHVLAAMGLPGDLARSAVRISLGWNTTTSSLEDFADRIRPLLGHRDLAVA